MAGRDGANLTNLMLLHTKLSLNDLADAMEAVVVARSWSDAASRNIRRQALMDAQRNRKRGRR